MNAATPETIDRRRVRHVPKATGTPLGDWIRKRRDAQGISQRELAERAGVSRSYLCDIERGRGTKPSIDTLTSLANALGVDRAELMRVAGILDPVRDPEETSRERRMVAVFRALSDANQGVIERYARFMLAEEQRWVQSRLVDGEDDRTADRQVHHGPTLFDVADL